MNLSSAPIDKLVAEILFYLKRCGLQSLSSVFLVKPLLKGLNTLCPRSDRRRPFSFELLQRL